MDKILESKAVKLAIGSHEFRSQEVNPVAQGGLGAGVRAVMSAVEISVGYGLTYGALKVFS